jgi:branched-chain amino acid transport system substrate-binding protein
MQFLLLHLREKKMKKIIIGAALAVSTFVSSAVVSFADELLVPNMTYRVGPYAANGTMVANGFTDYFTMLNERDGGIGGVMVNPEECETGYKAQVGVECYESYRGKNALVHTPNSTGITLQILQKAPEDEVPILTMGYGLSAAAKGETFPWAFNYPASYWSQMTSILSHINNETGLKGKKIAFLYLDVGYGREPIPVLKDLGPKMGFETLYVPVAGKEMQNQSSHWLTIRKEKPDWVIMWGWGAMNPTAIKEAAKTRFPLDRFIGNWWSGAHVDTQALGSKAKGYLSSSFTTTGTDFPAIQDMIKYVVKPGKTKTKPDMPGKVLYNRAMFNAVIIAEAIMVAQKTTGKKMVTGADVRLGLENIKLDEARLKELGLAGFTAPVIGSCQDHENGGAIFVQQWDGSDWVRKTDLIPPMEDVVQPLLTAAAAKYVSDKSGWKTQNCN